MPRRPPRPAVGYAVGQRLGMPWTGRLLGRGIPFWDSDWYSESMTTQIAVRLPDEMVAFLDAAVASGAVTSRATLIARAVEREMRRQAAESDAAILLSTGPDDDLDELVEWSVAYVAGQD